MHNALADPPPLAGSIASHVDLGLPSIEGFHGATSPADIVQGDHTIRIWISRDGVRIDDILSLAQRSLFVTATDAWAWDSDAFTAYHLGPFSKASPPREPASPLPSVDPLEMARRALAAIDPTTVVGLAEPRSVAGRGAYVLRLEPRTERTLVGAIEIAVDSERRVPLRVSVFARGATKPAVSVGFTSVHFGPVNPAVYRFTPPPGASIKQTPISSFRHGSNESHEAPASTPGARTKEIDSVRTFGTGWESIVAVRMSALPATSSGSPNLRSLLPYSGSLFSVRLVERGDRAWIVGGFVPQSALQLVESQLQ